MSMTRNFSRIKEVVASWDNIQRLLRTGDNGTLVPVVIPKDRRGFGWAFWFGAAFLCDYRIGAYARIFRLWRRPWRCF